MATQCLKQTTAVALLLLFHTVSNSGQSSTPDQEGGTGRRSPEGGMDVGGRLAAPLVAATPRHQLCCSVLGVCSVQSGAPTVGRTHQTPLLLPDTNMLHRERPFWTASNAMHNVLFVQFLFHSTERSETCRKIS